MELSITSLQNPLVKQMRKLHQAKERRSQDVFLLEGTHLLEEALVNGYSLITICCTPMWQEAHSSLWQQAKTHSQRSELVSEPVLKSIATTVNPDGVVATVQRGRKSPDMSRMQLGVALEMIQDPGNLGTVIRTAAAVGADGLWLSADSVDLDHPKVLRASAGQWFRLPMTVSTNLPSELRAFQQQGGQVVATLPNAAMTFWEMDLTQPTLILLGNEGAGLTPSLAEVADVQVKIPLAAGVESLNVAVAAALILYEARRQRNDRSDSQIAPTQ